jgi:hypothetical protein
VDDGQAEVIFHCIEVTVVVQQRVAPATQNVPMIRSAVLRTVMPSARSRR